MNVSPVRAYKPRMNADIREGLAGVIGAIDVSRVITCDKATQAFRYLQAYTKWLNAEEQEERRRELSNKVLESRKKSEKQLTTQAKQGNIARKQQEQRSNKP